jgi:hypothetical protein
MELEPSQNRLTCPTYVLSAVESGWVTEPPTALPDDPDARSSQGKSSTCSDNK